MSRSPVPFGSLLALSVCAAACRDAPPTPCDTGDLRTACAALQRARAGERGPLLARVFAAGAAAEPFLVAAFEREPGAAGAQATLALLGRIGGARSVALCRSLVAERGPLAVEAALALGTLPTSAGDTALLQAVRDRHCDPALRTAAACSLARHGERQHAPRLIEAVVRAGTPAGVADERELGLPSRPRWARERYFVQRLLHHLGHDDLLQQFDADASWPQLEALAPRIATRLRETAPTVPADRHQR
ncbi:MAG TPA: hypothetical protein ENI87_07050 [bacterium]|nr:hypothetical protein [bacterium]